MEPIIIRASRWRQITPLLICSGVLIVGPSYAINTDSMLLLIPLIAIFGGLAAYYIEQLWKNPKRLVIDEEGIWHAGWMINKVRWHELQSSFMKTSGSKEYLCFNATNREALRLRMNALGRTINDASRASGFGDFSLNTTGYGFSPREVVDSANKKIAES